MAKKKKWIQKIDMKEGAFTKYCKSLGYDGVTTECIARAKKSKDKTIRKRAVLAETFRKMRKK